MVITEAVVRRCSVKNVFLKISQNSQETPVPEPHFVNKVAGLFSTFSYKTPLLATSIIKVVFVGGVL